MSDLQDLIHKTSIDCLEKGKRMERERIIKLLEQYFPGCYCLEHEPPRICIHRDVAKELTELIEENK
jgi:hypothetical protein